MSTTVPIGPLTSPLAVSMFLLNMTHAPTAMRRIVSKPAVNLQSLFSLSSALTAFLVHLYLPTVSSTTSVQQSLVGLVCNLVIMSLLNSAHARLVGNRHTSDCAASCSSWYLADIVLLMTLLFKVSTVSAETHPWWTSCYIWQNFMSVICRSLIVSSSYTIFSFHTFTDVIHPRCGTTALFMWPSNTGAPLTGGNCRRSPTKRMFTEPNQLSFPNTSSKCKCKYARLRLECMDSSLKINSFTCCKVHC